jgi:hypothetical protein
LASCAALLISRFRETLIPFLGNGFEIEPCQKHGLNFRLNLWSNYQGKDCPLDMPREKLVRILNYFWLLVVFPVAVAILVGALTHSANLGIKTFLLIECGMAVLSPLLNAVISDGDQSHHRRGK